MPFQPSNIKHQQEQSRCLRKLEMYDSIFFFLSRHYPEALADPQLRHHVNSTESGHREYWGDWTKLFSAPYPFR